MSKSKDSFKNSKTIIICTFRKECRWQWIRRIFKYENYIYIGIIILSVLIFFQRRSIQRKSICNRRYYSFGLVQNISWWCKKSGIFSFMGSVYFHGGMPNFPIIAYNPRIYDFFYFLWDSSYGLITNSGTNRVCLL